MITELQRKSEIFVKNNALSCKRYFIKTQKLEHRLSIILGDRGIGKTTTIAQYMSNFGEGEALYISLDDIANAKKSIYEVAEEFELNGGRVLCLDEIHKYDNWSQELKNIYDSFPKLKVVASGSSTLQIHKGSHDLSRRAIVYTMVGMSFREFLELHYGYEFDFFKLEDILQNHKDIANYIINTLEKSEQRVITFFKKYLKVGYYPYYLSMPNDELFFKTIKQNINVSIESDLLNVYPSLNGRSIKKLKLLLAVIMENVPFTPTISKLKKSIEVKDDRTLKEYLSHLDDAGLIKLLFKGSVSMKNIDKPEKIYLANTNLMYITSPNIGNVRETFFVNQLNNYYASHDTFGSYGIFAHDKGDFITQGEYIFEVGGKNKSFNQIKDIKNSFIVADDIEMGFKNKVPLWLFGFLY